MLFPITDPALRVHLRDVVLGRCCTATRRAHWLRRAAATNARPPATNPWTRSFQLIESPPRPRRQSA
jgi:hypothetical protein